MKTSNYIAILFFLFLFGSLTVLHIDSKLYEDVYKEKKAATTKHNKTRLKFFNLLQASQKDQTSIEKWNAFMTEAKAYMSKDVISDFISPMAAAHITYGYKSMDQPETLFLVKKWIETALNKNPKNSYSLFLYATILFESGDTSNAIITLEKAIKIIKEKGHSSLDYYNKSLKRYKSHLKDKELKTGDKYIDVNTTDLNNKKSPLSEVINNTVTLINFWSPISQVSKNNNRKLFPLYYEYKNKGFEIVSLTETNNITPEFKEIVEIENYPWRNLVDIDKENRIWDQYGVLNTYSRNILVDKKGVILAIDPTEEELKELLNKIL